MQQAREKDFGGNIATQSLCSPILAMCLSSRRNLCIHPVVSKEDDREKVDSYCRRITAQWVQPLQPDPQEEQKKPKKKAKVTDIEDIGRCSFYDKFEESQDTF